MQNAKIKDYNFLMSDENTKNQDSDPDQNPVPPEAGISEAESAAEEAALLSEVDSILSQEDPDFLNQLTKIKIDSGLVDLSIMDEILGYDKKSGSNLMTYLKRPFEFTTNTKPVVTFWLIFFVSIVVIKLAWENKGATFNESLFLNSYSELGTELTDFNPNSEVESFYDNLRFAKNLVSISPMHVNLRPSENSGSNPMLAIEITAEGLSADAIIEIKDREAEFKDMLLRLTEEKNYDELVEASGKLVLCEQYRDLLNAYLTRGQVRKILLKSFVIKP